MNERRYAKRNGRLLAIVLLASLPAPTAMQAANLYSDNDFAGFPSGWTVTMGTNASGTIARKSAPAGGANSASLHVVDSSANSQISASTAFNGKGRLTKGLTLEFDLKMSLIMKEENESQLNGFFLRVHDGENGADHSAITLQGTRAGGAGNKTSRLAFSGLSGNTVGYFEPDTWYHIRVKLPSLRGQDAVDKPAAVLTGLHSAEVRDLKGDLVPSLTVSEELGAEIAEYKELLLNSGNGDPYFSDTQITNIRIRSE